MQKKQKFPYLVGSRWTAVQKMWGWRHFQVVNRKNEGKFVFAEMVAACDASVRFWINAKSLKDRSQWQSGWQSLQEQEQSGNCGSDEPPEGTPVIVDTPLEVEPRSGRVGNMLSTLVSDPDEFI